MTRPLVAPNVQVYSRKSLFVWKGFLMVIKILKTIHFFIISFSKEKNLRKLLRKIGALFKRKPLHGTLAFEWFSFSQDV